MMALAIIIAGLALGAPTGVAAAASEARDPTSLHAVTAPIAVDKGACYFRGDTMRLKIIRGTKEVFVDEYCSAYGNGSARLITDTRGRNYVLLTYLEGHGSHASTTYLRVDELIGNALYDRGRLVKSEPIGIGADLVFDLSVRRLPQGGLRIIGTSRVDGPLDRGQSAPPRQLVSLTVN